MGRNLTTWRTSASAVVGRKHLFDKAPCQDVVGCRKYGGVTAIVLADGAGSARQAELGARIVVEATMKLLVRSFDDLAATDPSRAKERIIQHAVASLRGASRRGAYPISELASTLLFVAVKGERFVAGQLGDGVLACEREGQRELMFRPERGEHLNETVFVTSPAASSHLMIERGCVDVFSAFAVMSDGAAESLHVRQDASLAPALSVMWRWLDSHSQRVVTAALAENVRDVLCTQTGDDCSIALLRKMSPTTAHRAPRTARYENGSHE